jgi:hypothetical protein
MGMGALGRASGYFSRRPVQRSTTVGLTDRKFRASGVRGSFSSCSPGRDRIRSAGPLLRFVAIIPCSLEPLTILTEKLTAGGELTPGDVLAACELLFDESVALSRGQTSRALHLKGETPRNRCLRRRAPRSEPSTNSSVTACLMFGHGGDRAGLFNVSTAVMLVAAAVEPVLSARQPRNHLKVRRRGRREALGVRIDLAPEVSLTPPGAVSLCAALPSCLQGRRAGPQGLAEEEARPSSTCSVRCSIRRVRIFSLRVFSIESCSLSMRRPFGCSAEKAAGRCMGPAALTRHRTLGSSEVHAFEAGAIRQFSIELEALGIASAAVEDLRGGNASRNAQHLEDILRGSERGPKRDIVVLNSACALVVSGLSPNLSAAAEIASTALDDGSAYSVLRRLREVP